MADIGIKRVVILKQDLPPVSSINDYKVRCRIVSEDKNRASHWSSIFNVNALSVVLVSGAVQISGDIITAVWKGAPEPAAYDIFIKFDAESYKYHGTSSTHTFSFLKQTGSTSTRVLIQIEGSLKEVVPGLKTFESAVITI